MLRIINKFKLRIKLQGYVKFWKSKWKPHDYRRKSETQSELKY